MPVIRNVTLAIVDRFSATRFWQQVRSCHATHVHYLGGILQILLKQPPESTDRDHQVRVFWGGGCRPEQWRRFEERFGISIRECYGMTEASSITTGNELGIVGSVGRTMPWFSIEIQDVSQRPIPRGERGEIVVKPLQDGPLFAGYFRDQDATTTALRNGILYTGDVGSIDELGNLHFYGRMRDSVRSRGENVSAWEVESVAAAHPAIEECAMIGVLADVGEQDIKLFVKLKPGSVLDLADLSTWLAARLAPYQVPKYYARVDGFERTPSERIIKHLLSEVPTNDWDVAF
jgi:crotonobetaine/carnitine-CoA ligase